MRVISLLSALAFALAAAPEAMAKGPPEEPSIVTCQDGSETCYGKPGGKLRTLIARPKDIRIMTIYGYARLVHYTKNLELEPDILAKVDVEDQRIFTFHIRKGHKWSDGTPFTAEDFRYKFEDVMGNSALSPAGYPASMKVDGKPPRFTIIDERTVRYEWDKPNPVFLPKLAAARPLYLYAPSKYLKQFHQKYADNVALQKRVFKARVQRWTNLHQRKGRQYRPENPDLPTLQPWMNTTTPPAKRYVFERNPHYHRVDGRGVQLPYIDKVVLTVAEAMVIPAKVGTGESDLQERYLRFDDYTFLKAASKRNDFDVTLWQRGTGAAFALYPNLNAKDAVWRKIMRERRFRQALSLAIFREEINQILFYGLAKPSANTVLAKSPLFDPDFKNAFASFQLDKANELLDELALKRDAETGLRLLPDGRPLRIVVETAGESSLEADILSLIAESWKQLGIELLTRPSQRDLFRRRVQSGQAIMSAWSGFNNGIPSSIMAPTNYVPAEGSQLQWPLWGKYVESGGKIGKAVDYEPAKKLLTHFETWMSATTEEQKMGAWKSILDLHAKEVFTIGVLNGNRHPVVYSKRLRNLPKKGTLSYTPTSYFGVYKPDQFWLETEK